MEVRAAASFTSLPDTVSVTCRIVVSFGWSSTRYFRPDHLNSTNVVTNASGTVIQVLDYYPYGSTRIAQTTGGFNEGKQFIAQYSDPETNLSYLQQRYMDGSKGEFLSEDPSFRAVGNASELKQLTGQDQSAFLGDPQQMNSYSYGRDNPIVNKDPSGLWYVQLAGNETWGTEFGTGGIRFDQYGIEYYGGGGTGAGVEAGVEAEVSTGELTHTPHAEVEYSGTYSEGIGGTGSFVTSSDPTCKKCTTSGSLQAGVVLGGGGSGAVSLEYSKPLITWSSPPSKYNLMNSPPGQNQYNYLASQNASLSQPHGTYSGAGSNTSGGSGGSSLASTLNALKSALSTLSSLLSNHH